MSKTKFIQCSGCKVYIKPDFVQNKGVMEMTCPHCSKIIKFVSMTDFTEEELYLISEKKLTNKKSKPLF